MTRVNAGRSVVTGRRPSNIKVAEDGQFKGTQPEINFSGPVTVTNDEANNRVNIAVSSTDLSSYLTSATAASTYETIANVASGLALKQALVNAAVALVDAATIDLTAIKHTLATSSATRTFTISYTGDDITLEVTLSATSSTFTFPATSLCVSEGIASGDNTCALSGVSGDKYMIAIKKIGTAYYVVCKNFGQ